MTYKQIEASRELRLWIGQVIVPTAGVLLALAANPNVRELVEDKFEEIKAKHSWKRNGAV